jgi:ribosome-associated heat shock protein Hsp15
MVGRNPILREVNSVRIDRWLCAARIFKSRTQATLACAEGRVRVNGASVKASHLVKVGDEIRGDAPRGAVVLDVKKISDKRLSSALARELYDDRSPPPPPRDELFPMREAGMGRPTKLERRAVRRVRGR